MTFNDVHTSADYDGLKGGTCIDWEYKTYGDDDALKGGTSIDWECRTSADNSVGIGGMSHGCIVLFSLSIRYRLLYLSRALAEHNTDYVWSLTSLLHNSIPDTRPACSKHAPLLLLLGSVDEIIKLKRASERPHVMDDSYPALDKWWNTNISFIYQHPGVSRGATGGTKLTTSMHEAWLEQGSISIVINLIVSLSVSGIHTCFRYSFAD